MSDINIEKDDQATQEMLAMMGEITEEMDAALKEHPPEQQDDDLLNALDGLPDELEKKSPPSITEEEVPDENSLNLEDIDAIMSDIDDDTETSIEVSPPLTPPDETTNSPMPSNENEASKDTDIQMNPELEETLHIQTEQPEKILEETAHEPNSERPTETSLDELIETKSSATDTETEHTESKQEEVIEEPPSTEQKTSDNDIQLVEQTQQSVRNMEEAIQIDQEVHEIATQIQEHAQEAIQTALITTEQAQHSAEQIQQAIQDTFSASEKALQAAQAAGYIINFDETDSPIEEGEITQKLQEIEEKNAHLKEINNNLKQRILELKV